MRGLLVRWLNGKAASMADGTNIEPMIELTEHGFDIRYVKPDEHDDIAWDDSLYHRGNIFFDDYANPIKPRYPDDEDSAHVDLIASERYKTYMKQKLIKDALQNPEEDDYDLLDIMVGLVLVIQIGMASMMYVGAL